MKTLFLVAAVLSVSGCAAFQARTQDGKMVTCVPNNAMDRGPFKPTPAPGTALVVNGEPVKVAERK